MNKKQQKMYGSLFKSNKTKPLSRKELQKDQNKYSSAQAKKIDFYKGYIYIHLHQEDIGRINNKTTSLDDQALANEFLKYKDLQNHRTSMVGNALRRQYIELLKSSVQLNSDQYDFLNEVLDGRNKNKADQILDKLNNGLKQGFEQQFSAEKITALLNKEKEDNWSSTSDDFKKLNDLLQNQGKEGFEILNDILNHMIDTVYLLQSEEGNELGKLLSNALQEKALTSNEIGSNLSMALNNFINKTDTSTLEGRDAVQVAENFKKVTETISRGTNKQGDILTSAALQTLVQNNFYSLTAEVFASHLSPAMKDSLVKYIGNTVADISLIGDTPIALEYTTPEGYYGKTNESRTFFQRNGSVDSNYGKADLRFNNVIVEMSLLDKEDLGQISMSVGISNKAYVTNTIGADSIKDFNTQHFSLGGGMTLGNAFTLLFGQGKNLWKRYLGYNILGKGATSTTVKTEKGNFTNRGLPNALNALQDVLLTRSLLYLVAGRSKEDFAQFMLLNGRLLAVWDIVKYALNNNIGKSKSQQTTEKTGIYMSIPNRENIQYFANVTLMGIRVPDTNNLIDNAVMKATILPGIIAKNIDGKQVQKS